MSKRNRRAAKSYATFRIRKSSIRLPDFNFAASQRGVFPRPAQVSDGRSGFRNFGTTAGYGRRPGDELSRSASARPLSRFRRFSSSSVDIDLKSFRFTTVPNHDAMMQVLSWVENMSRIRPLRNLSRSSVCSLLRPIQPPEHFVCSRINFLTQSLVDGTGRSARRCTRNYEPLVDDSLTTRSAPAFIAGIKVSHVEAKSERNWNRTRQLDMTITAAYPVRSSE
jgi:hypothetical protein